MTINTNISAFRANTQLTRSGAALSKSTEKLASGYKINHAYDDPAGLAIANKMRTQIRALKKASDNTTNAISVMQIADGALDEVGNMLQRMNELSIKAANGTMSDSDRDAVQKEVSQLRDEINRISETTSYNTLHILNGELERKTISNDDNVTPLSIGDGVEAGKYKMNIPAAKYYDLKGEVTEIEDLNAVQEYKQVRQLDPATGKIVTNNVPLPKKTIESSELDNKLSGDEEKGGLAYQLKHDIINNKATNGFKSVLDKGDITVTVTGTRIRTEEIDPADPKKEKKITYERILNPRYVIDGKDNFHMEIKISSEKNYHNENQGYQGGKEVEIDVLDAGYGKLQLGANTGDDLTVSIPKVSAETLNLENMDVTTQFGALQGIERVTDAIAKLSAVRSKLGAYQNRLESTFRNTGTTVENMTSAFSGIMDTDMAEEITKHTQYQVLEQAGTSVLSQANQRPERILSILQG